MGVETLVTVEFRAIAEGTEIVVTHEGFPTAEVAADHEMGWASCIDGFEGLFAAAGTSQPTT